MTIPTRPAPAPPQMRHFNMNGSGATRAAAAADANTSLEQLRLQLQQQQQQPKLTIKLPPPPKGGITPVPNTNSFVLKSTNSHNNSNNNKNKIEFESFSSTTSITRKFPKARYAPATNWDDTPFDPFESTTPKTMNGNAKKVPPPRPPPPKVILNGHQKINSSGSSSSTKILSNIFHRKKNISSSNTGKQQSAARVYGLSSGNHAINPSVTQTRHETSTTTSFTNSDWNSAWNTTSTNYATTTTSTTIGKTTSQNQQEAQLISFDSPPSSPTFTQKSNSDCVSVDSFSSDSNFSSPQNGSVSQPESGFEDDFSATSRSRPATTSPLDPWEAFGAFNSSNNNNDGKTNINHAESFYSSSASIGTAPVRNLTRLHVTTQDNPLCNGKNLVPPSPSVNMPTIIKPKISQKPKAPRPPVFCSAKQQQQQSLHLPTPPSPPMPQSSLPPPPSSFTSTAPVSILDVISGKADALHLSNATASNEASEHPYGIALYDFDGVEEGDLSFKEGEKIYLLERVSEDWYRGRRRAGCEGIFPINYIDIKVHLTETESTTPTEKNSEMYVGSSTGIPKVRCLYNFPAELEGDLELKEDDMVTVLYRINEDWLYGEMDNRRGQFPANFLEYIPANIPLS